MGCIGMQGLLRHFSYFLPDKILGQSLPGNPAHVKLQISLGSRRPPPRDRTPGVAVHET